MTRGRPKKAGVSATPTPPAIERDAGAASSGQARRSDGDDPPVEPGRGRGTVLLFIIVVAAAMAATLPALRNGLFWDDAIVLLRQVPAMAGPEGAFFPPPGLPQFIPSYYRPVVFLTLLVDRALWGGNLLGFHLDVWLLHALTGGLFFLLMRRLMDLKEEGRPRTEEPHPADMTAERHRRLRLER